MWLALTVSNLLFGAIMLTYSCRGTDRSILRLWGIGQVLKGLGILLILFKPFYAPGWGFVGNSLFYVGYGLEFMAFLGYGGHGRRKGLALTLLLGVLVVYNAAFIAWGRVPNVMAAIFTFGIAVLTLANVAAILKARRSRSAVQWVLAAGNCGLALAALLRAGVATVSATWQPESASAVNQALFMLGYLSATTDGFSFLLLVKEDADRSLLRMATVDELTGLSNRATFMQRAAECWRLHARLKQPLAAVMMDIDHFKTVNDRYGHAAGDEVLRLVGTVLHDHLREVDICGRMGGEEFAILLPGSGRDEAELVAERVRCAIAELVPQVAAGTVRVTASLGVSVVEPGQTLEQLLSVADVNLYRAKQSGRDRVV